MQKDLYTVYTQYRQVIVLSVALSIGLFILMALGVFVVVRSNEQLSLTLASALVPTPGGVLGGSLVGREEQIIGIVDAASPAVVSIVITKEVLVSDRYGTSDTSPDFFNFFFSDESELSRDGDTLRTQKERIGAGSGFLVSSDGLVVTNRHVVDEPGAQYEVVTSDGTRYEAAVLARDTALDIALLKIEGGSFSYLTFGNSDEIKVGQTVIAIGNALGEFRNTTSVGVVSGLSRNVVAGDTSGRPEYLDSVIQTDAAINLGNSGGPLLDLSGAVVGVNVAVAEGSENIGFALPGTLVESVVVSVQEHGTIIRPYLGIRYIQITSLLQEEEGLPVGYGVLVAAGALQHEDAVLANSPAERAGLREGDIVLSIDGVRLTEQVSLASIIRKRAVGDSVQLVVLHDDRERVVEVILAEKPAGV